LFSVFKIVYHRFYRAIIEERIESLYITIFLLTTYTNIKCRNIMELLFSARIRQFICLAALLAATVSVNCCYIVKQGTYVFKYTTQSKSIAKLQNSVATPDSLKTFLSLVSSIRAYAKESVGLSQNHNYTTYVAIQKPYLLDVVCACGKTNFTPYQWHYPLFGSWPLRGYFEEKDAQAEALRLEKLGYDVYKGKSGGFSTLGFFSDPVYSYMQHYSLFQIANLIIHEQTHATIYIKNNIQFNEELASFVGTEGALGFIKCKYGDSSAQYREALMEAHDDDFYYNLIRTLYVSLLDVYKSNISEQDKIAQKNKLIDLFRDSVTHNYESMFQTNLYCGLEKADINNAFIAVDMVYAKDMSLYYDLYKKHNNDLYSTFAKILTIKNKKGEPKELLKKMVIEP